MEQEIEHVLTMYFAGEYELTNLIISEQPELRAALVEYVEEKYGWAKPYMYQMACDYYCRISPSNPRHKQLGTPFDWLFGERFYAWRVNLNTLGALPPTLVSLQCPENQITKLPPLPRGLRRLDVQGNKLRALPQLPEDLEYLDCRNNLLISLPLRPALLKFAATGGNMLQGELPAAWKGSTQIY